MPIRFPQVEEIRLEHPPLEEVICQVRFPPILKIVSDRPAEFQERIREQFPNFAIVQEAIVSQGIDIPAEAAIPVFHFKSLDDRTTIALATNFVALSTSRYVSWDGFRHELALVLENVIQVYSPKYASRIGLRYINKIAKDQLDNGSVMALESLLHSSLAAPIKADVWDEVKSFASMIGIPNGEGTLNIRYGISADGVLRLDFDYFEEAKSILLEEVLERCDRYHAIIHSAFRWCLTHEAVQLLARRIRTT